MPLSLCLSKVPSWCVQRIASIGLLALVLLLSIALWLDTPRLPLSKARLPSATTGTTGNGLPTITGAQLVFVCYTVLAHVMGLLFPLRLCWATWSLTRQLAQAPKSSHDIHRLQLKAQSLLSEKLANIEVFEDSCSSSSSDSETLCDSPTPQEHVFKEVPLHAIIIPNYKEEIDTLKETLEVLACHPQASTTYEICLAMEQGEKRCKAKATILLKQFKDQFRTIEFTVHPSDIPGEAQGKSSNLCWAAQYLSGKYEAEKLDRSVIITVIDADSHLSANYFKSVTDLHNCYPQTADTTIYVPPIIFDRNAHQVPMMVRVADIVWAGGGLSGHCSVICPPTSVYSMSLSLVRRVDGWDADDIAIGEDLHMYLKCFFALNGKLTTRTVLSAASQSNVCSGGKGVRGWYKDCAARYKQALRHMWGAVDSGFVARSFIEMVVKNRKDESRGSPAWYSTGVLLHRMYEAHFLPAHIALLMITGTIYPLVVSADRIPSLLLQTLDYTGYMRLISLSVFFTFFGLYERYHYICVNAREEEMTAAGLKEHMVDGFSHRSSWTRVLDYVLFPISGVAYGSFPTMVALIYQLWTLKLVYRVSVKPKRAPLPA